MTDTLQQSLIALLDKHIAMPADDDHQRGWRRACEFIKDKICSGQLSSEIPVIERGTIQHLVKREIPMLLLGLSQREPDEGEVTTTDEFLSEIENALESCRNQLEAVMLNKRESGIWQSGCTYCGHAFDGHFPNCRYHPTRPIR